MNRARLIRGLAPFALLGPIACTSILNAGFQDDGGQQTSTTTTAGAGTSGSSSGAAGTSTGQGSSSGAGSSTGTKGTGSSGTTGGTTTGSDAGPCLSNGTQCVSSNDCCSVACANYCSEGAGAPCFMDPDCISYSCKNGQCACSPTDGPQSGFCGTSQDCCDQDACTFVVENGYGYGLCCNDVGSGCQSPTDCCDGSCANGQCQCLAVGASCAYPVYECCSGICTNGYCQSGPGGPCSTDINCSNANCVNETTCGTCGNAGGACSSQAECCNDLICASRVVEFGDGAELGAVDGGPACCGPAGASCQLGSDGTSSCCGECDGGTCVCLGPTGACAWDQACCAGGACMPSDIGLECCQVTGQTCFSAYECCTGYCGADSTCACMPDGGWWAPVPLAQAACCDGVGGANNTCL